MTMPAIGNNESPLASNPLLAFWAMPFILSQAWMTAWLGAARRGDEAERNQVEGQIPVPTVFQDKKDHELFA
ncbi:MAG: hypothetical protein QHC67_08925 [Sphingobium sp.]|uniref:hypothetical protein n=1 Tax=Sphingobium sp. TaxID=1912891 RepID=UPI0029AC0FB7|nr:hypothetical protein [Sphingobium sp.]MDX3909929.1 hypothetical protein [Sphingobium sp.]